MSIPEEQAYRSCLPGASTSKFLLQSDIQLPQQLTHATSCKTMDVPLLFFQKKQYTQQPDL